MKFENLKRCMGTEAAKAFSARDNAIDEWNKTKKLSNNIFLVGMASATCGAFSFLLTGGGMTLLSVSSALSALGLIGITGTAMRICDKLLEARKADYKTKDEEYHQAYRRREIMQQKRHFLKAAIDAYCQAQKGRVHPNTSKDKIQKSIAHRYTDYQATKKAFQKIR